MLPKFLPEATTHQPIRLIREKLRMAVKPVLASDLITQDSIGLFEERARERLRVGTGCCASIDDALSGGLVYGQDGIYNISGATGSRAAETVSLFLSKMFRTVLKIFLFKWNSKTE